MRRFALVTLILFGIAVLLCVTPVIASDCGCGGLPDNSPPDGWDSPGSFSGGGGSDTGGGGSDSGADPGSSGDSSGDDTGAADTGTSDSASSDGGSDSYSYSAGDSDTYTGGGSSVYRSGSSEDATLLISRARTFSQQGNYEESLEAFNLALAADHYSMAAWMGKANVETLTGAYDDAVASYDHATRLDPGDADPWVGKGSAYLAAGEYDEAIASFDRALVIHPGMADALENRALAEQLKAAVLAVPDETPGEVSPGAADGVEEQADSTLTPAISDAPEGNEGPGDVLLVSVPGSAPSMLPMLVAIMAFAVIVYRRREQ